MKWWILWDLGGGAGEGGILMDKEVLIKVMGLCWMVWGGGVGICID